MNNLANKFFANLVNFAETPGVIANAADKLLSQILPKENAAADVCVTRKCYACRKYSGSWRRPCRRCCVLAGCYWDLQPC
jgi:hypothetical protein